jgi:type III pantothenate kinase
VRRKLIIDIGNTLQKLAVFEEKKLIFKEITENLSPSFLSSFIIEHGPFNGIIQSSVVIHDPETEKILIHEGKFILLTNYTPVPVKNLYETPESLGKDRIAGSVGAWSLFPGRNILIIDAGTCITYDLVNRNGEYLGGGISPGLRMRFKAMNTFTGKLPLIEPDDYDGLIGRSTRESILSGVYNGVLGEIRETIRQYHDSFDELVVFITGGDSEFLHSKLKIDIFAAPELVLFGLNEIFDYNDLKG